MKMKRTIRQSVAALARNNHSLLAHMCVSFVNTSRLALITLMFMCWQIISWIVAAQAFRHGVEADEIGGGLGQAAQSVVQETRPQNNVVGARGVVDMKGFPAAIIDHQVFKIVADALGVGTEHPAPGGVSGGLCHENPVMMTVGND